MLYETQANPFVLLAGYELQQYQSKHAEAIAVFLYDKPLPSDNIAFVNVPDTQELKKLLLG